MTIGTSFIEISESAIKNNLKFIHNMVGKDVTFSSVVKGNAYGHGIKTYCPMAYLHGVRHFSVSDSSEAFALRAAIIEKDITILIMGMIDNQDMEWAIENDIEFYVFNFSRLDAAIAAAQKTRRKAKVHLQVETGMNRLGFETNELSAVLALAQNNPDRLEIKGICTHLAGAESIANYKRISDQQSKFKRILTHFKKQNLPIPKIHMASSAATIRYPKTRYDLVRVGILQYGFFPTEEIWVHYLTKNKVIEDPLKRVISWKTRVMDTKNVLPGNFVGYGNSYLVNKKSRIAIIPVGYSSGYSRSLSNKGKVIIRGQRLDVIGTVNMNMMAIDITDTSVETGDEVVLIGSQRNQEIGVSSFSDYSEMVNYELLTRLPKDIPRIKVA
ncbi:MAG: alanine racemase [Cryomorphaceae bacterium]